MSFIFEKDFLIQERWINLFLTGNGFEVAPREFFELIFKNMANDSERWQRVEKRSQSREPFHSKASRVALHMDPNRRRNLDKEQAAKDRMIFRWVMFFLSVAGLLALMMFVVTRLGS